MAVKKNKISDSEVQMTVAMRHYAKSHQMVILAFRKERNSGEVFGVAIQESPGCDNKLLYSFGRLYRIFDNQFAFDQCGCYSSTDEKEVRLRAYSFFGIK